MSKPETTAAAVTDDPLAAADTGTNPLDSHPRVESRSFRRDVALTLGALGVVFGDIGTSPLYAMRQTVLATSEGFNQHLAVMGALSLIIWSLALVVTLKYVILIMRADNNGEG